MNRVSCRWISAHSMVGGLILVAWPWLLMHQAGLLGRAKFVLVKGDMCLVAWRMHQVPGIIFCGAHNQEMLWICFRVPKLMVHLITKSREGGLAARKKSPEFRPE